MRQTTETKIPSATATEVSCLQVTYNRLMRAEGPSKDLSKVYLRGIKYVTEDYTPPSWVLWFSPTHGSPAHLSVDTEAYPIHAFRSEEKMNEFIVAWRESQYRYNKTSKYQEIPPRDQVRVTYTISMMEDKPVFSQYFPPVDHDDEQLVAVPTVDTILDGATTVDAIAEALTAEASSAEAIAEALATINSEELF